MSAIISVLLALRLMGIPATVQVFSVSAYVNSGGVYPYQGLTASGWQTGPQTAACGPDLPFGTHLYIDGVGWRICQDRGGEITEGFVDLWFSTEDEAWEFGRSTRAVIVVSPIDRQSPSCYTDSVEVVQVISFSPAKSRYSVIITNYLNNSRRRQDGGTLRIADRRCQMTKEIVLSRGTVAIVDDEDYQMLRLIRWHVMRSGKSAYARTATWGESVLGHSLMHRVIMGNPVGKDVDHINGNGLDNRKANLRICTTSENLHNADKQRTWRGKGTSSAFKGVYWHSRAKKWAASLACDGKNVHLGLFESEKAAALAFNQVAVSLFGDFARLNDVP